MNKKDYYNRPSLQTSYQIAAISLVLLILTLLIMMVSEVVNDFDNTYTHSNNFPIAEISYQKETIDKRMLKQLKARRMNRSIY